MARDDSPAELLRFVETADDWSSASDRLAQWGKAGRWGDIAAVHTAVCKRGDEAPARKGIRTAAERLAAADASTETCDVALAMLAEASRRRLPTELPRQIPEGHAWNAVKGRLQALATSLHPETVADLVTGFLLLGRLPENDDFAEAAWKRLASAGSALAWVLPRQSEMETHYGQTQGRNGATGQRAVPRGASPALARATPIEVATLPAFKRMLAESNGKCEAVRFESGENAFVPSRGFVLELTRHFGPLSSAKSVSPLLIDPPNAVGSLLRLAINGSVYERPLTPARGRLAVWKTLTTIVKAPADAPFTSVEAAVAGGTWIELNAHGAWFYEPDFASGCLAFIPADGACATAVAWTDID